MAMEYGGRGRAGVDGARAVVVRSGSAEGSGYVLGGRLVLTAAHVLRDRGEVSVQLPGRQGRVVCRVVWDRLDEGPQGWDAALLLAGGPLSEKALPPVRWGRLVTLEGCPAQVIGYPIVGQAGADVVTRVQRDGRVLPESGRDRDRYVLSGDAGAETRADGLSPWSGMSGAALWCGSTPGMPPLLAGVVAGDPPGLSHTRLEAVPAYVLASDPSFRSVVEEHTGRAMLLEPADLQHVTDRTAHPRPPRSPADLLRPEQAVVSFMGREKLLDELAHWCQDPEQERHGPDGGTTTPGTWLWDGGPVQAQLLTGGGGAGKTRLATELCARMTGRGWTTIRLTTDISTPLDALTQVRRPLLIVADYAETRIPQLHALLNAVDHDQAHTPVRILALARAAGDWWTRAIAHPHSQALAAARVTAVPALHHTVPDRAAAYRQAVADFAARLCRMAPGTDWTAHVPVLTAPGAPPSLARAEFDTPLSVQMAALLALLDATGIPRPTTQQTTSLEGRLLGHEQKYWDETAVSSERGLSGERSGSETRALAVAVACLTPATDRSHARELLSQLPGLADEGAAAVRGSLTTWLGDLYPAPAGSLWGSIQPDRIAEYHLGTEARREPALFTSILATLREEHSAQALTVLARTAQHAQHHDTVSSVLRDAITAAPNRLGPAALTTATLTPYPEPLIIALTHLIENTHDIDLMYQLSNQLTRFTLALSEWAAALNAALVEHHDTPTPDLPRLATALNNQAIGLASLGRREEALNAVTRAVEIRENLAAQQPDAFLPDLASSLNNQSIRLADLGRREEALNAATRAVETYQALTEKQRPNAFSPRLAMALNNQSNCLASLGRREEALNAATRAVEIRENLAAQQPDAFLPDLASSLNNQSNRLAGLGRREEALSTITRAVEIREALAAEQPDVFLPDLAGSLANQSGRLRDLGRREEALDTITRAVITYQALAEKQPATFLPGLGAALSNQSSHLADLGRREEALNAATRAVEIRENLAAQQPDAFLPDLASSLNNQSIRLADLGRREEALNAVTRAVEIRENLAAQQPDAFLPDLASSLTNQSNCLRDLGSQEEALEIITRVVNIRETLAKERPNAFLPDLASALNNQCACMADLGRPDEALIAITRAVEIRETLAAQQPDAFLPDLAGSLNNQSSRLADLGHRKEALATITRAVETYQALAEKRPTLFASELKSAIQLSQFLRPAIEG
ncbi:TPR domain protein [Streptomyces microflavus DSM 40593]|uniref:TPR domain protein n=1 Tax=Streptomyces microflavus DSM 40593 TaxID=1303692 RepID=N0CMS3_STRMI|nr:tetratricopeptide repeat protein [Streptomyces microflavus]AGK76239.1 TPR domain protein [Streptomyces microflavus DSM 40593]